MSRVQYYPAVRYHCTADEFLPSFRDPEPARTKCAFLLRAGLALLYPPRCPFCDRPSAGQICPDCEKAARTEERPIKRLNPGLHYLGRLEGAAAVYAYKGAARKAVLRVKYRGTAWNGPALGCLMANKLFGCTFVRRYGILSPEYMPAAALAYDVIVPVPPSDKARGYNLPTLLAQQLCEGIGLPLLPNVLVRVKTGRSQAGLPFLARMQNAAGAFEAVPGAAALLEGRRVLLVDDVITTGATAAACTHALLQAGAESVFAVSLCVSEPKRGTGRLRPAGRLNK